MRDGLMRLTSEILEIRAGLRRLEAAEPPINVAAGKTLKVEHSMTLTGADGRVLTIPATGTAALLAEENVFAVQQTITNRLTIQTSSNPGLHIYGTTPGFLMEAQRVAGGGVAISPFTARFTNIDDTLSTDVGSIGFYGSINSTPTPPSLTYMFIGLAPNTAYNTALVKFTPSGRMSVGLGGTSVPSATIHGVQSSATGALPVLRLQQADLSEEFIRFHATVGTGNPINTDALGSYYGRVRVYVEGVGAKWLALYN